MISRIIWGGHFGDPLINNPKQRGLRLLPESGFNHAVSDGVPYQLAHGMHLQFAHDVGAMGFRSLDADTENHGHFFAALALSQELHNLSFARTEAVTH